MSEINYSLVGEALIHPIQRQILEVFVKEPGHHSPLSLSRRIGRSLGITSYHVKLLAGDEKGKFVGRPLLELVGTEQRRGAMAHFYDLTKRAVR